MRTFDHRFERRRKLLRARQLRGSPTPAEAHAWQLLRKSQFEGLKFRRQHVIGGFIVAFYCASQKLALELDGNVHGGPDQQASDAHRDAALFA